MCNYQRRNRGKQGSKYKRTVDSVVRVLTRNIRSSGAPSSKAVTAAVNRSSDILDRSVRLHGLPPKTQEGLLQQALEKIVPVKKVEFFQDTGEASVELASAAVSGICCDWERGLMWFHNLSACRMSVPCYCVVNHSPF